MEPWSLDVPVGRYVVNSALTLSTLLLLGAPALAAEVGDDEPPACREDMPEDVDDATYDAGQWCLDREYRHPLKSAALYRGQAPLVELRNSARGYRYAISETASREHGESETHFESKIVELRREPIPRGELRKLRGIKRKSTPKIRRSVPEKLGPTLRAAAEKADATPLTRGGPEFDPVFDVAVGTARPTERTVQREMELAIARGDVDTESDARAVRKRILAAKKVRVSARNEAMAARLRDLGFDVTRTCQLAHCLYLRVHASELRRLQSIPDVRRIEVISGFVDDSPIPIDRAMINEVHDTNLYVQEYYHGDQISPIATCAVIERGIAKSQHDAFLEFGGSSTKRILSRADCPAIGKCDTIGLDHPAPTSVTDHATQTTGIVLGDFTDFQSAKYSSYPEQYARSSSASEAQCHTVGLKDDQGGLDAAFTYLAGKDLVPEVINMSSSNYQLDTDCGGNDIRSRNVNQLAYENSMLLIKSAGNDAEANPGSPTNCSIGSPGSAIGAFTVTAFGTDYEVDSLCDLHDGGIMDMLTTQGTPIVASWGGNNNEGGGRTIIDLAGVAPTYGTTHFLRMDEADEPFTGTSASTPTVTAAALNLISFYVQRHSDLMRDPGILFANLLLMGDRQSRHDPNTRLNYGFDNRWGAGRMRMRLPEEVGLDWPWKYGTGSTCIDTGEDYYVNVNGSRILSNDIESGQAVIWWYTREHADGQPADDVDLYMLANGNVVERSIHGSDNKERVYSHGAISGKHVQLRIRGYDVHGDSGDCGPNSVRVFWAFLFEDSDRDDWDGSPTWDPETCEGVPPL